MASPVKTLLLFATATSRATACLAVGDRVVASSAREVTTHSEGLLSLIDEVLAGRDVASLDAIVVGRGPGSFTGLRIGVATAKGLCLAAGVPLIGVSTLAALIEGGRRCAKRLASGFSPEAAGPTPRILAILDARRGEVFYALDGEDGALDERVARPEALIEALVAAGLATSPLRMVGDGALSYAELFRAACPAVEIPDDASCHLLHAELLLPVALAHLAAGEVSDLAAMAPVYLRTPDIRKPQPKVASSSRRGPAEGSFQGSSRGARKERLAGPLPEGLGDETDPELSGLGRSIDRESGLRLDREGRWWHEGHVVENKRVARAFHRWLDRLDTEARYILRLDAERYVYVDVDDAPYVVRIIEREGEGAAVRIFVLLSDGSREELDYGSLRQGEGDALYATVKMRFAARFSRQAQALLADLIDEGPSGFLLRAAGKRFSIA